MRDLSAPLLAATLCSLDACWSARTWAEGKTLAEAWAQCPRGDWMLWLANEAFGRPNYLRAVVIDICKRERERDTGKPELFLVSALMLWAGAEHHPLTLFYNHAATFIASSGPESTRQTSVLRVLANALRTAFEIPGADSASAGHPPSNAVPR